jgi:hypothetical protein
MREVFAILLLACCTPTPYERPEPPPPPIVDGGTPCERTCARARQLECAEAQPEAGEDRVLGTDDDITCEQWACAADYLDHDALAVAPSCAAFR